MNDDRQEVRQDDPRVLRVAVAILALVDAVRPPRPTPMQTEWVDAADSPLGKRQTLALARAGAIVSTKVGRKVLVSHESLSLYLAAHRRDGTSERGPVDLFAVHGAKP